MRERPLARIVAPLVAVAALAWGRPARAQEAVHSFLATSYYVDYSRHAGQFADAVFMVPKLDTPGPWWALRSVLLGNRQASELYLLGDDRLHAYPTKLGILGWGMCAGLSF